MTIKLLYGLTCTDYFYVFYLPKNKLHQLFFNKSNAQNFI